MAQRTTIQDIAEHLGVSKGTVSLALNDAPGVNSETRRRVKEYARQVHYAPNQAARAMNTGRSRLVAVVLARLTDSFFEEVVQGIEDIGAANGYDVIVSFVAGETAQVQHQYAEELVRRLVSRQIDGLIGNIYTLPEPARAILQEVGVPTLYLGPDALEGQTNLVVDNPTGGKMAVEYLYQLGHRRILYLGGNDRFSLLRYAGGEQFLNGKEATLEYRMVENPGNMESAYYSMATRLRSRRDFTAIFCASDILAVGACKALQAAGIAVPEEISVVGFDDLRWTRLLTPSLTTVHQPQSSQGETAMRMLMRQIEGEKPESAVLMPRLVVRDSTGPAPGFSGG